MDYKSLTLSQQTFVRFLFALYFVGLQFSAAQQCKSILSVRDDVIEGPFVQEMTATTTPPFPENGAGKRPVFDGVELLLLGHATPPDMLQHHIARLGAEFKDDEHRKQFSWPEMSDELEKLLSPESISSWDFDLFRLNELTKGRPLAVLAFALIHMHGLMTKLKIDETVLKRYLVAFEDMYNTCMYHNPMHAADVMQALSYLVRGEIEESIAPDELFITLLAGPAHDIGHPGVNNAFLIKQQHPIAIKYNNTSVLETHHATLALDLMAEPDKDVLSFLSAERKDYLRHYLKELVLHTDLSLHNKIIKRLEEAQAHTKNMDLSDPEDRKFTLQTLLHAADLSNPCKPWNIHVQWTHAILAEFFSQGDLEREMGLEVIPMLDRNASCGRTAQKNFFIGFVRPLFHLCVNAIPEIKDRCQKCLEQLDKNVARWTELGF
uniref:Phosphodiesterase n=1 Tax=Guillardia theta TaxID=55529 RepID=A0A7S4NRZ4_GUITH|mmetsp:Transcript_31234/g.100209  ORF Transcript_31234/g.100209 Transcript_31234/m.100209 type:complete len:435 (+) Transcript_31234:378-1682(+)